MLFYDILGWLVVLIEFDMICVLVLYLNIVGVKDVKVDLYSGV